MFSKLLQVSIFAIMISSSLCFSIESCNVGYKSGTDTKHVCQASHGQGAKAIYYNCPMSGCNIQDHGEISRCTPDPGQNAPAISPSRVLKCEEFYSTTPDGQIHCRSQHPYHFIVKCQKWKPIVCDNCQST
ncbi:uncharacterized protein MELLADRAFT_123730 [Melampsora larici-populina 98AG31]|uniref:Secreted protein n=1 Tax=Melampsora larici-populina (strain 98AG31 / pathotype 3-4-7) TaxID=747676 RepID=F4RU24_MELLP|nr:uncharacterized protein MELLADRAFT_123730 [Melampsora larici-populina 98AG31]EGG04101.1 secreted protein [Melampsora larici-populina 98AG31]